MKRPLALMWAACSSRAVPFIVVGLFFLLYLGIAFFTDETLITLIAFTARSKLLAALLALIPLNCALRIVQETISYVKTRTAMSGRASEGLGELFDEVVELQSSVAVPELTQRLVAVGYKTKVSENSVAAWKGISRFPARILFLAGMFCLFAGILVSVTSRTSQRQMVVEGAVFPSAEGNGGIVERITLATADGPILSKTLDMEVSPAVSGAGKRTFGLYPPSLYEGAFVYPRYLGLAIHVRFSAPDMPMGYETQTFLNVYPPGKEDNVVVPDSPYRLVFSVPEPETGSERYISYMTGNIALTFKMLKGKDIIASGSVAGGGEFARDGYRLALPDVRRLVVTDFIRDYGVFFIWLTALLFTTAAIIWLPLLFFPRREMLFLIDRSGTRAGCSAEGGVRRHSGVFHELLDLIDGNKPAAPSL